jgi:hypothetical protein
VSGGGIAVREVVTAVAVPERTAEPLVEQAEMARQEKHSNNQNVERNIMGISRNQT